MDTNLNIELRKEVLEIALGLEFYTSQLLIYYLNIEKEERKAISSKSSSLSFKNKIDLLYDLEVLTKDEHDNFLLIMEFRNQFLHNYQCNSFEKAIEFLNGSRSKKLLSFYDSNDQFDVEFKYLSSFRALDIKCINIVQSKIEIKKKQGKDKHKFIIDLANYSKFLIDQDTDLLSNIEVLCLPNQTDSNDVIDLKLDIKNLIDKHTDEVMNMQEIKDYENSIDELLLTVPKYFK